MAHVTHRDLLFPIVVKFWGVRGSFPTSDVRIGGHTTCLTLQFPDQLIIFDTGSGMIDLGNHLLEPALVPGTTLKDIEVFTKVWLGQTGNKPEDLGRALQERFQGKNGGVNATVIHSHVHKDHLDGLTAFKPVFRPDTELTFIGSRHNDLTIEQVMERFVFTPPVFPVPWKVLGSRRTMREIAPSGDTFTIPCAVGDDIRVRMLPMNHPNQAYGYRFEWGGRVIAVTLDHEHGHDFDRNVVELADNADLWITEAQYTDAQYARCKGFGHISETAAAAHAKAAKPRLVYTTHHDPDAGFDDVQQIARTIQEFSGVEARYAWQGSEVHV
ncbi:MBL fold metallo-hydrolase [Candidatus Uhrbacteria bacterium]|nr:MBL fold metallo-hydrolase [Candidatus Uhrbacteria bacterium]